MSYFLPSGPWGRAEAPGAAAREDEKCADLYGAGGGLNKALGAVKALSCGGFGEEDAVAAGPVCEAGNPLTPPTLRFLAAPEILVV